MKKSISLWLCLLLALSLCACGGASAEKSDATEVPAATQAASAPTEAPEPMDSEQALDAVMAACPLDVHSMKDIKASRKSDNSWLVTFNSDYGDFMYLVDGYTGEILERDEPDMSENPEQEMIPSEQALDIAEAASGLKSGSFRDIKVARRSGEDRWVVTFTTDYGGHMYVIDGITGEILDREEPDMTRTPEVKKAVANSEDALDVVEADLPIDTSLMKDIKVSRTQEGIWMVSFASDYGDFLYGVEEETGEIVIREEPDLTAPATVMLTSDQALNKVFAASGLSPAEMKDIKLSKNGDDWVVTFHAAKGDYMYVVAGYTGEILDRSEP